MKTRRKIIQIDEELCDGCGECIPSCAEGALQIIDGKARVVQDRYCDGLGACLGECPNNALSVIERDAEEFDEDAVEEYLAEIKLKEKDEQPTLACGCPSTTIQSFVDAKSSSDALVSDSKSALSHWPVQILLVPPEAPFLRGADLLIVADCTPLAFPDFHSKLLPGKAVMMGCPKFDNIDLYLAKFEEIFKKAKIKSITTVFMEVPCCSGLPMIVEKAMKSARTDIPISEIVISTRGKILDPK